MVLGIGDVKMRYFSLLLGLAAAVFSTASEAEDLKETKSITVCWGQYSDACKGGPKHDTFIACGTGSKGSPFRPAGAPAGAPMISPGKDGGGADPIVYCQMLCGAGIVGPPRCAVHPADILEGRDGDQCGYTWFRVHCYE